MKLSEFVFFMLSTLVLDSCTKENVTSMDTLNENVDTTATLLAMGYFENGPYGSVSGKGLVYRNVDGSYSVMLDSFTTTNGPDLYVYLSKQAMPINFIEAGKLKSTMGKQVYNLASAPDLSEYRYICIHCKQFNHLFGFSQIK